MSSDLNPLEKFSTPDLLAEIARRMGVLSPAQLPNKLCRPVIISGPSGVGKGTLVDMLIKQFPNDFGFSVSHTTRQPRPGETEGVHYHYTTRDRFLDDVKKGNFLEYAEVHGNLYGTNVSAVSDIRNSRRVPLIEIDVQGCMQIFKKKPFDAQYVFVTPPSLTDLEARLRDRSTRRDQLERPGQRDRGLIFDEHDAGERRLGQLLDIAPQRNREEYERRNDTDFAHAIPGSFAVAVGAKVRRGQRLARVGNSGNSSEPHLHFQLMNAPRLFRAQSLPAKCADGMVDGTKRALAWPDQGERVKPIGP